MNLLSKPRRWEWLCAAEVLWVAVSPNGRTLAAGGWDSKLEVWNLAVLPKSSQ